MNFDAAADLGHSASVVYDAIADLSGYPEWLTIVARVAEAPAAPDELGPAWFVDLQGRIGPLRRTKRVRMVRTRQAPPAEVRFERDERDGKRHSAWVLVGAVEARGDAQSRLTMRLHYSGAPWVPGIDIVLRQEIKRAGARLDAVLDRRTLE